MITCSIKDCNNKHYARGLCKLHWSRQWRLKNKDKVKQGYLNSKEYYAEYYQDNKEKIIKYSKQWRINNKEHYIKQRKQYYQDNKEHILKYNKQYQQNNKEKRAEYIKPYMKAWYQTPSGKASSKAHHHNRRISEKGLTKETVQRVYEDNIKKYGTLTCVLCGKPVEFKDSSLEHLTPLSRGGSNLYENLGVAHLTCNLRKYIMTLEEWRQIL